MNPLQLTELIHLLHKYGSGSVLEEIAATTRIYAAPGPIFGKRPIYNSQAEIAIIGLSNRDIHDIQYSKGFESTLIKILNTLLLKTINPSNMELRHETANFLDELHNKKWIPRSITTPLELASLAHKLAKRYKKSNIHDILIKWADWLKSADGNVPGKPVNKELKK